MSRQEITELVCPSGHKYSSRVYRSANVTLVPSLKDDIIGSRFNKTRCPTCQAESYADVSFLYHDMPLGLRVWVYPERDRAGEAEILSKIRRAAEIANTVLPTDRQGPELIFGLDELRALIKGR